MVSEVSATLLTDQEKNLTLTTIDARHTHRDIDSGNRAGRKKKEVLQANGSDAE